MAAGWQRAVIVISDDDRFADVTIDQSTSRVTGATPEETRRLALDAVIDHAVRSGQEILIDARDAGGSWQLVATPARQVRSVADDPAPLPPEPPPGPGPVAPMPSAPSVPRTLRSRWAVYALLAALAGVVVAVAVAAVVVFLPSFGVGPSAAEEEAGPPPVRFEARPPSHGFTDEAIWSVALTPGTRPAVSPEGDALAAVAGDGRLTVLNADGAEQWAAEFPFDPEDLIGPLRYIDDGEGLRISARTGEALWLWPADGGDPQELRLPEGADVTYAGGGALVTVGDDRALVARAGELVEVEAGGAAWPMLFDGDGVLFSGDGQWLWQRIGGEPGAVDPERPDAAAADEPEVLTSSRDHIVLGWQPADSAGDTVLVAVHAVEDGSVVAAEAVAESELGEDARWEEAGDLGAYGPLLVDLQEGSTRLLSGFAPIGSAGEVLYGELDDAAVVVEGGGEPVELPEDTARPWGLMDGHAVVVAEEQVYALIPE